MVKVAIDEIVIGKRHRKDFGDLDEFAKSISTEGLLQPIGITENNELVFGERRLRACRDVLGLPDMDCRIVSVSSILAGEIAENDIRKEWSVTERVAIYRSLRNAHGGDRKSDQVQNFVLDHEQAAKRAGFKNYETARQAEVVATAAEQDAERFGKLAEDMDRTGKVNGPYKRYYVITEGEKIRQEKPPLPTGRFRVIAADPAWPYEKRTTDPSHRAALPYPTMTIEEICALKVSGIAHDDCILWLWTTNHHMREAYQVLDAWEFQDKTILTWRKSKMGTGDWLRGQTEHCIMAVRGKPIVQLTNQTTILDGPVRKHSQKPDEFYELVEKLCPAPFGGYAELFQRIERPGWVGHGNEVRDG